MLLPEAQGSMVPLFTTSASAGFPGPTNDHKEALLDFNTYLVRCPASTFCIPVSGESMKGAGIFPNDVFVVDRSLLLAMARL